MSRRYGWWVMIAVMVLLGGRTVLAARSAAMSQRTESKETARLQSDPLLTAVDRQDSLLVAASLSSRDPFRAWTPTQVSTAQASPTVAAPAPVVPPRVAVVMDTGTSVIIQIEVDGETSPRLPIGGTFRGWTITNVSASTVTVAKAGKQVTVPRP